MTEPHELSWNPLTPQETAALFDGWNRFWCIAGGWAIDLNTGQVSREHKDVDVLVLRRDIDALHARMVGWELWMADPPGTLRPWLASEPLPERAHDIWGREAGTNCWRFQLMMMDHDDEHWIFRRDLSIGRPLGSLAREVAGVPVIALEIQLLYKGTSSAGRRPKDEADFWTALPHLSRDQQEWLRDQLAQREPDHPWIVPLDQ